MHLNSEIKLWNIYALKKSLIVEKEVEKIFTYMDQCWRLAAMRPFLYIFVISMFGNVSCCLVRGPIACF
jgi:hypothetical protein